MSEHNEIFKERLEDALVKLKACQNSIGLDACMPCNKLFECELRKTYVKAVYDSMSKGQSGGFEF